MSKRQHASEREGFMNQSYDSSYEQRFAKRDRSFTWRREPAARDHTTKFPVVTDTTGSSVVKDPSARDSQSFAAQGSPQYDSGPLVYPPSEYGASFVPSYGHGTHIYPSHGSGAHYPRSFSFRDPYSHSYSCRDHYSRSYGSGDHYRRSYGSGDHYHRSYGSGDHYRRSYGSGDHYRRSYGSGDHCHHSYGSRDHYPPSLVCGQYYPPPPGIGATNPPSHDSDPSHMFYSHDGANHNDRAMKTDCHDSQSHGRPKESSDKEQKVCTQILKLQNVPPSADMYEIIEFFGEFNLTLDRLQVVCRQDGIATGEVYVEFDSIDDAKKAISKDKKMILTNCVELFPSSPNEASRAMSKSW